MRSLLRVGLLGLLALSMARGGSCMGQVGSGAMTPRDEAALKRALDAYDQGDMAAARPLLSDLSTRYPRSYEANEALGSLLVEVGELPGSLVYLRRARDLAPEQAIAHANLGAAYLKLGLGKEAVPELRRAAAEEPENGSTQSNLAQALMLTGEHAEAAKRFGMASRLAPGDFGLRYDLALALFESGSASEAAKELEQIPEESRTDQTEALGGDVSERLGDYPKAIAHFQAAAKRNPSDANLYALTLELLRHWTWAEALKIAEFGAGRYPASTHFRLAEGIAHYGAAHYTQAATLFSGLLREDAENVLYADLLGRSCAFITDETATDCSGLEAFARKHPENAQAATYAATSLLHRPAAEQDVEAIRGLLHQAIKTDPKLADAYFEMGVLEQTKLEWAESATMLEKAIALKPSSSDAHYRLSRAYSHLGRKDEAQQQMELHQRYSQEEKDRLNAHLQEVVIFLVKAN